MSAPPKTTPPKTVANALYSVYVLVSVYTLMIVGSLVSIPFLLIFGQRRAHNWTLKYALGGCIPLTLSRTTVTRHPDLDPQTRGVYIQNHVSVLDGSMATWVIPHAFCGLFNKWHFWVPGYGWIMKLSNGIGVPSTKEGRSAVVNAQAADRARRAISILAFPEGHRTMTGRIGPFRRGAFFMAREAGYPVIPLCIRGMYEVENKHSWRFRPGHLEVYFGRAYDTKGLSDEAIGELAEKIRRIHVAWVEEGRVPHEDPELT